MLGFYLGWDRLAESWYKISKRFSDLESLSVGYLELGNVFGWKVIS